MSSLLNDPIGVGLGARFVGVGARSPGDAEPRPAALVEARALRRSSYESSRDSSACKRCSAIPQATDKLSESIPGRMAMRKRSVA